MKINKLTQSDWYGFDQPCPFARRAGERFRRLQPPETVLLESLAQRANEPFVRPPGGKQEGHASRDQGPWQPSCALRAEYGRGHAVQGLKSLAKIVRPAGEYVTLKRKSVSLSKIVRPAGDYPILQRKPVTLSKLTSIDPNSRNGFTIVEAFMVMVILGILGMIALPRYSSFATTQKLEGAVRRVTADLLLAQRQAIRASASQAVSFNVAQNRYQLVGMNHPDHPSQPFDIDLGDEPYRARIVSASFGSDTQIIYDGFGKPDSGGQVVIAVGAYQKTVQVDVGTGKPLKTIDPIVIVEEYPPPGGGAQIQ